MAECEVAALREALDNQSLALKELYAELEEERQASTSGTNEALSMILRLQEEKAVEKMEACQYKRMAEEKLQHAEESLEILKEVIFQKDIEIASLKYQINAYRRKLAGIGVKNLEAGEVETFDYPCLKSSTSLLDKACFERSAKRNISLPAVHLEKLCYGIDIADKDNSLFPTGQSICWGSGDYMKQLSDKEHKLQEFFKESAWEPAETSRKLKEKERISGYDEFQITSATDSVRLGEESRCSWYFDVSGDTLHNSISGIALNGKDALSLPSQMKDADKISNCDHLSSFYLEPEADGHAINPINLQDIHEVPESSNGCNHKELQESTLEAKQTTGMPKSMPQEPVNFLSGDKDLLKKECTFHENKFLRQQKEAFMNYRLIGAESGSEIVSSQADVDLLKKQMQQLEDDVRNIKQEEFERNKELWRLLRGISEQLDTIQSEINSKSKKFPQQDEPSSVHLMEAMLYFWL
ncbi:uncharacterized protein [Elaeis guineensis]|uniref:Uncharacterized protein LOC105032011 isoform X1 n=1 Tax=Elaeis guineensis var. tenera TaxID=51953 RepID=A0A6I9Q8D5_ELAGV|nr:uncharacterized protein LOC105032011 isoform X1 [Elaeis guineensis]XP_019701703.1 uncharacterized protein LOC105032011 isoform X1 [Elaeis guineensis]XP_029116704.1 uncharacterized protein LOC105032011 isoform X1 [Elaeis guineensis]